MKYYQVVIQTLADDTQAIGDTFSYADSMSAEAAFHSQCSSAIAAIKAGTCKAVLVKTFGTSGADIPEITKYYNNIEPVE